MIYHYHILDVQNNIVHESKKGIAKIGFDSIIEAARDGELIMDLKFPIGDYYVHVYSELEPASKN